MPQPNHGQKVRLQQQQQQQQEQQRQLSGKDVEEAAMLQCIKTAQSVPPSTGILDPRGLRWKGSNLESAYERCGAVTSEYAKTFYLGTQLMTPVQAKSIWAIYVWCRRTDELVDGPNASKITPQVCTYGSRGVGVLHSQPLSATRVAPVRKVSNLQAYRFVTCKRGIGPLVPNLCYCTKARKCFCQTHTEFEAGRLLVVLWMWKFNL